ncbi:MAG: hypothetical protein AAFR55_05015, partial [Pseudomonadota bacterium]
PTTLIRSAVQMKGAAMRAKRQPSSAFAKRRTARRAPRRLTIAGGILAALTAAFLLRNSLPDMIALFDFGPPEIAATSLADRNAAPVPSAEPDDDTPALKPQVRFAAVETGTDSTPPSSRPTHVERAASDPAPSGAVVRRTTTNPAHITVAAWTFNAPDLVRTEDPEPAWRTSFGSERIATKRVPTTTGFDADVIAVTGIRDFQLFRRIFPARDYFAINAPQLVNQALIQGRSKKPFAVPAIAIVIRRGAAIKARRRVQTAFLMGGARSALDVSLAGGGQDLHLAGLTTSLPFAVELIANGSRFWLVAVDRVQSTARTDASEAAQQAISTRLERWIGRELGRGAHIVVAKHGTQRRLMGGSETTGPQVLSAGIGGRVDGADRGCKRPDISLSAWRGRWQPVALSADGPTGEISLFDLNRAARVRADDVLFGGSQALWRTRPTGGDCVLLVRFATRPRWRRPPSAVPTAQAEAVTPPAPATAETPPRGG